MPSNQGRHSEYPPKSSTTIFDDTPCYLARKEEIYKSPPGLEVETTSREDPVKTLTEVLKVYFPPEQSTLGREVSRLRTVFSSTKLEYSHFDALALYNIRQTDYLQDPIPDFPILQDYIQRKTMEADELPELLFYLLIEVVIMDLLVPLPCLPPPAGPCWSYQPWGVTDAQTRSTQLTKTLTFVDHFELVEQARGILPRLEYFASIQERNETTAQNLRKWTEIWTQVQSTLGWKPMQPHHGLLNSK